jgi:hypothetical protein
MGQHKYKSDQKQTKRENVSELLGRLIQKL